jgi:hypothetical protein
MKRILLRILIWIPLSLICLAVLSIVFLLLWNYYYQRAYDKINLDDNELKVISIIGTPSHITPGSGFISWDSELNIKPDTARSVIKEFWYNSFLEGWIIGFDKQNKVISKYHYMSP